jgi:hypothetical protein
VARLRVPEMVAKVVVASQVGTPLESPRTKPFVLFAIEERVSAEVV